MYDLSRLTIKFESFNCYKEGQSIHVLYCQHKAYPILSSLRQHNRYFLIRTKIYRTPCDRMHLDHLVIVAVVVEKGAYFRAKRARLVLVQTQIEPGCVNG